MEGDDTTDESFDDEIADDEGGHCPEDPDDNNDNKTDHGKERADDARTDPDRNVGDPNDVIRDGKKFTDTKTGYDVYVKGDKAVVVKDGKVHTQFKNSRRNTRNRVDSGRWEPCDPS